jgi:hypothetical protein
VAGSAAMESRASRESRSIAPAATRVAASRRLVSLLVVTGRGLLRVVMPGPPMVWKIVDCVVTPRHGRSNGYARRQKTEPPKRQEE